jgi:hypothetical protein
MAAKDFLSSLDIPSFKCVYISFGSKINERNEPRPQHLFPQSNPFFLQHLCSPYLCIAIDPGFKEDVTDHSNYRFATIPVDELPDAEAMRLSRETQVQDPKLFRNLFYFKMVYSIRKTEELTEKLVQLLKPAQRVFVVNCIKFRDITAHDAPIGKHINIQGHLGPFQKDYYEWGGYQYPHLIIKQTCKPIRTETGVLKISSMIGPETAYKSPVEKDAPTVLPRMYDDFSKKNGYYLKGIVDVEDAKHTLLQCVLDITDGPLTSLQIEALKEQTAGKKTRRRRSKKRK